MTTVRWKDCSRWEAGTAVVNGAAGQGKGRAKEGRREEEIERKHEQAAAAGSQRLFAQAARQRKAGWQSTYLCLLYLHFPGAAWFPVPAQGIHVAFQVLVQVLDGEQGFKVTVLASE